MAFTDEQRRNAAIIMRVGKQVGASSRDLLIALMTAMQESGLRNVNYGDRDSLGLFQQRTSMDWGSTKQIMNPEYAARAFFLGAGTNKGLLDYDQRNSWSLTQAAQQVQRSAYPDAYAKHEDAARKLLGNINPGDENTPGTLGAATTGVPDGPTLGQALEETLGSHLDGATSEGGALGEVSNSALGEVASPLGEVTSSALATTGGVGELAPAGAQVPDWALPSVEELTGQKVEVGPDGWRGEVAQLARKMLGTPYVWGGTSPNGFDCSGLLQYVYGKVGINLPRISADQARSGKRIGFDNLRVGDLVALDNSSRNSGADHIGIAIGNGMVIHAPRPGASVEIAKLNDVFAGGWGVRVSR